MSRRNAFTLVELLVVIAIIGILVALLLPAVQAAREAARRTQCKNQMRQMAIASLNHHDVHSHLPTSGWGWRWQPDPDRGFGVEQPGGWTFNILPFMEEQALRDLSAYTGTDRNEREAKMLQLIQSTVPVYNCPSRREPTLYTYKRGDGITLGVTRGQGCKSDGSCSVARTDYAANGGNSTPDSKLGNSGPDNEKQADLWDQNEVTKRANWIYFDHNGVIYQKSIVKFSKISDGTSKTALIGEKYVPADNYTTGLCNGDDQNTFVGHDQDSIRYTGLPFIGAIGPAGDENELYPMGLNSGQNGTKKLASQTGPNSPRAPIFGAAHPGTLNMAFCDGSVQSISYDVEPSVFYFYGGRNDDGGPYPPRP